MYGIKTCEVWAWHIIMDSDQKLDFKVGTGEVYNLHVWPNDGGGNAYFISFRPMVLPLSGNIKEIPRYQIELNGKQFEVTKASPELTDKNITVKINGKDTKIISMQKYYETGRINSALPAYLIQVSKDGLEKTGKQTVALEFECVWESKEGKAKRNSMGYYQFYLNHKGLSQYW